MDRNFGVVSFTPIRVTTMKRTRVGLNQLREFASQSSKNKYLSLNNTKIRKYQTSENERKIEAEVGCWALFSY